MIKELFKSILFGIIGILLINLLGQLPQRIFTNPHPERNIESKKMKQKIIQKALG